MLTRLFVPKQAVGSSLVYFDLFNAAGSGARLEILSVLPRDTDTVFQLEPGTRDALFRRARDAAGVKNLHFHDSRAEAIWRLSKRLDVMELARMIGHRDLKSLMWYYQTSADELADKLG